MAIGWGFDFNNDKDGVWFEGTAPAKGENVNVKIFIRICNGLDCEMVKIIELAGQEQS